MRKRTVRSGMRLVVAALILIIVASFYHAQLSDLFLLSPTVENRVYSLGIFWAAAVGGFGVLVTAFGLVLSPLKSDDQIRIMPIIISISAMIFLFFYLLSSSMHSPDRDEQRRMRPGETITI